MHQFTLSWQNISVDVVEKQPTFWKTTVKKKTILSNVSGMAISGSLIAIIGPSGAGKTTFLAAISGRFRDKKGVVKVNNTIISNDNIKNMSGYVHQQDIFTETLTSLEHLTFLAALQLKDKSEEKRQSIIKKLISELGLEFQKDTLIKNLSGGEGRRLSLAGELLNNPYMLFCDEPTTGLDSYSAITVIQKLQTIALAGKIVIATIHQPSSELFHYFNDITLLAEGKLVFQGTKDEARSFFQSINLHCPSTYNPADFYIKCLTDEDVWKMCDIFKMRTREVKEICSHCDHFDNIFFEKKRQPNFFCELKWLLWRCFIDMRRNKSFRLSTYLIIMVELIFVALFFASVNLSSSDSVQNIQGVLSFISTEMTYCNMYAVINVFPGEVAIFLREKNLYTSYSYFMSKIVSVIPLCIFSSIAYMSIFFVVLNFLNGFDLWFKMTYMMILVSITSSGLGLAFSATFSKVEHIDLIMGPLELALLLLSGFLVRLDTITQFLSWCRFVSPFYYGFDSLSNLYWRDLMIMGNCTDNANLLCYKDGNEVLRNYGVYKTYDTVVYDILYLHILTAAFCLIGFVGILRKKWLYNI